MREAFLWCKFLLHNHCETFILTSSCLFFASCAGFGPFGSHTVNASWVAVQELAQIGIANDVDLITTEIPVEYDTVRGEVPQMWAKYKPKVSESIKLQKSRRNRKPQPCLSWTPTCKLF